MKRYLLPILLAASALAGEPEFHDVFTSGTEGYASIRIPSVVVTKAGTVLAFAEGRVRPSDQAENDIVMKRSTDGGRTWSALRTLHDDGANSLNNPTVVQEQRSGRIFLWYQRIPAHLRETDKNVATGFEGPNVYRNFLMTSDDDGVTWSAPLDVTATTKRPERATTICSGPGAAIQLTRGPHAGRLVVPFNEGPFGYWQNFAVISDDAGKTWRTGADAPGALLANGKSQINEVQMAEMNDGSVRLDSRQFGGAKRRKTAASRDGGETWSAVTELADLTDPSCMAGFLRYSFDDGSGLGKMIHTGPDSTKRDHGTVWLSTDDGASFPIKRELYAGGFAYSVPVRLPDGHIGVLFEKDNYRTITFARIELGWLTQGANYSTLPESRSERSGKFGWWMARHEQKLMETKDGGAEVVFLGDSITQNWETAGRDVWQKHFAPRKALNLGFGGDSTQHVLWRLDHGEFDDLRPKVCVLLIGTNNARHSESTPAQIAEGVKAIIERIAQKSPQTKIVLHAILPRGVDANDPWRKRCMEINSLLPALADGQRVHFVDFGAKLVAADGTLSKEIAPDLLHLSAKGYELWADALESKLHDWLGEK